MTDKCNNCGKPKPPDEWTPFDDECESGYTIVLNDGTRHKGFCDSKISGLKWPPDNAETI